MTSSVLRELEELKSMLETPQKTFTPFRDHAVTPRNNVNNHPTSARPYTTALSSAEKSVDRLGRAIEAAEDEMEAALKRTTEVHRSQLKQKELELSEMSRVVAAKERSIDSLRDTLSTTKRTYDSRLSQAGSAAALKDVEIKALMEELRVSRMEREGLEIQLQREVLASRGSDAEMREREAELSAAARARGEEAVKALAALKYERKEKDALRGESGEMRRQAHLLAEELHALKHDSILVRERLESEVEELRKRYRSEKSIRKACEKWLRAELRSREEMELLLSAVKDAASGKMPSGDLAHVERLIDNMRARGSPPRLVMRSDSPSPSPQDPSAHAPSSSAMFTPSHQQQPSHHPLMTSSLRPQPQQQQQHFGGGLLGSGERGVMGGGGGGHARGPGVGFSELASVRQQLEDDNRRLQGELLEARKALGER
ncbi:MAG: hypothetical protein WDW38_009445 [Sanguina aurantia]